MIIKDNPLYSFGNKKKLAKLLSVELKDLESMRSDDYYKIFSIKTGKKEREVQEPKETLKKVHAKLQKLLKPLLYESDYLTSGKKRVSYIDNAKMHTGSKYVLTLDIDSFYSKSQREFIFKFLNKEMKMTEDVAWLLADVLSYRNFIPTGSPVSQIISFLSYRKTFDKINSIANSNKCGFTLYVDDMTFSCANSPKRLIDAVNKELKKVSLQIKKKKTKLYGKNEDKLVTGVCISDGKITIPNKLRHKIHEKWKEIKELKKSDQDILEKDILSFIGLAEAAQQIEDDQMIKKRQSQIRKYLKV